MSQNVKLTQKGRILTIEVDLSKDFGPSNSGKTTIIASTEGTMVAPENPEVKIGLNVYKKPAKG